MYRTGPRSEITHHAAPREGNGTSRRWTRTIAGRRYSFTAVTMPDGERRYAASRLDGADARFACSWHHVGFWTIPADTTPPASCPAPDHAAQLPAQDEPAMIALPPLAVSNLAGVLAGTPGAGFALGRLFVQTNRDGSAVIYLAADQG